MFVVVIAADKPAMEEVRARTKERHKQHLDRGAPGLSVLQSGPLLTPEGKECGSLIVFDAVSLADVRSFVDADPYSQAGLFASVKVHPWNWRRGNPYLAMAEGGDTR